MGVHIIFMECHSSGEKNTGEIDTDSDKDYTSEDTVQFAQGYHALCADTTITQGVGQQFYDLFSCFLREERWLTILIGASKDGATATILLELQHELNPYDN